MTKAECTDLSPRTDRMHRYQFLYECAVDLRSSLATLELLPKMSELIYLFLGAAFWTIAICFLVVYADAGKIEKQAGGD